jgi:multiple sugar transport system substrate-binding protein
VAPAKAGVTVRFLERAGTNYKDYFGAAITAFQKDHPDLTIQAEWTDKYTDKLVAEVAGGTPPDLAFTSDDDLFSLAAKGLLLDIAPYFRRDKLNKDDYFPIAIDAQFLKGKQWAMPLDLGVWVFFVNKDLFKKAGVPLPDGTWDFAKLQQVAEQLTRDETGATAPGLDPAKVVQAGFDAGSLRYGIDIPAVGYGGSVFNADASSCTLNEQSALDGLQWVADLSVKAHAALGPGITTKQKITFDAGNLALKIGGSWSIGAERQAKLGFDWDIAIPPKGPVKDEILAEASGISQIKEGKNPDGAWLFNSYMTGPAGQELAFQYTVASVPSLKAVAAKVYQGVTQPASMPILADLATKSSIPYWQRAVSDTELETLFGKELTPLWQGKQTAQDVIASVKPHVDVILASDQKYLASL